MKAAKLKPNAWIVKAVAENNAWPIVWFAEACFFLGIVMGVALVPIAGLIP